MNTPIQGSAADIIKKAMIDMAARLKKNNYKQDCSYKSMTSLFLKHRRMK